MRIVFFTLLKGRQWGGSENLWFKTAILALKDGHKILIIAENTLDSKNLKQLKELGAEIFFLENYLISYKERLFQIFEKAFAEKKFLNVLNYKIHHFGPDLMLINQPGCYDLVFNKTITDFLALTKIKYMISFHSYVNDNVLDKARTELMGKLLMHAITCFFVAKKQANTILQQLKIDLKQISYIFNPLNLNNTTYLPYPKTNEIKFAMVSSLDMNWKGHDIILNILAKPEWTKREWSLAIFGTGPDLGKISDLIVQLNLTTHVKLNGHVKDIREIWSSYQILLMPSRVDAAPAALLEAMACGRTAICTNIGFVEDWIEDNENGFISEENAYEAALNRAWLKRDKWENMGKLAAEKINKDFPNSPEKDFLQQLIK